MSDYYVKVHANGRNKSQHCWAQQCWVLLVNNVGSVCISLKEWQADRSVVGDSRSSRRIRIVKILHNRAANRSMRKSVKVWQTSTIIKERSDPTWPRLFRNRGRPTESLKAHANRCNKCQQLPTLLGVVGQQSCVRLHGPKSLTGFKLYATSANIVVVPCKRKQQVTTLLGPTMLGVVGQQCWVRGTMEP